MTAWQGTARRIGNQVHSGERPKKLAAQQAVSDLGELAGIGDRQPLQRVSQTTARSASSFVAWWSLQTAWSLPQPALPPSCRFLQS
jgi:hypothetical protein